MMDKRIRYGAIALVAVAFVLVMAIGIMPVTHAATTNYTITFIESGLPSGTSWSVTLNGTITKSSTTNTIQFTVYNGTTNTYVVNPVPRYTSSPSSGSITVDGSDVSVPITFDPLVTLVTIKSGRGVAFPSVVSPGGQIEVAYNLTATTGLLGAYYKLYLYLYTPSGYVTEPITSTFYVKPNADYLAVNVTITQSEVKTLLQNGEKLEPSLASAKNLTVFVGLNSPFTPVNTTSTPEAGTNEFTLLLVPALENTINGTRNISYYPLYGFATNKTIYHLNITYSPQVAQVGVKPYSSLLSSTINVTAELTMSNYNYIQYPLVLFENQTEIGSSGTSIYLTSPWLASASSGEPYVYLTNNNQSIIINTNITNTATLPLLTNTLMLSNGLQYSYFMGNMLGLTVYNASENIYLSGVIESLTFYSSSQLPSITTTSSLIENVSIYSITNIGLSTSMPPVLNIFPSENYVLSTLTTYKLYPGEHIEASNQSSNIPAGVTQISKGLYYINPSTGMIENITEVSLSNFTSSALNTILPLNYPYWGSALLVRIDLGNGWITYAPLVYNNGFAHVYPTYYVEYANKSGYFNSFNLSSIPELLLGQYVYFYGYGFKPGLNVAQELYELNAINATNATIAKQLLTIVTPCCGSNMETTNGSGVFYFVARIPYTGTIANQAVSKGLSNTSLTIYFNISSTVPTYNYTTSSYWNASLITNNTSEAIVYINPVLYLSTPGSYVYEPEIELSNTSLVPYNATQPFTLTIDGHTFTLSPIAPESSAEFKVEVIGANASALYDTMYLVNSTSSPISTILKKNVTLTNGYGTFTYKVPNLYGKTTIYANITSYNSTASESSSSYNHVNVATAYEVVIGKYPIYRAYSSVVPISGYGNTTYLVLKNVPITIVGFGLTNNTLKVLIDGVNKTVSTVSNGFGYGTIMVNSTNGFLKTNTFYNLTVPGYELNVSDPSTTITLYYISEIVIPIQVEFSGSTVSVGEPYIAYVENPILTMQVYNTQLATYANLFTLGTSHTKAFTYTGSATKYGTVMSGAGIVPTPPTMYSFIVTPPDVPNGQLIFCYNQSLIFLPWPYVSANAYGVGEAGIIANYTLLAQAYFSQELNELKNNLTVQINSLKDELLGVNSTLSSQIANIKSEVTSVNNTLNNYYGEMEMMAKNINSTLSSQIANIKSEVTSVNNTLSSQIANIKSEVTSVNNTLNNYYREAEMMAKNINSTLSSLSSRLNSMDASISSSLSTMQATLNGIASSIGSLSHTVSTDYSNMKSMISSINTNLTTLNTKVANISSGMSNVNKTVASVGKLVESLSSTVSSLSSTVMSLSSTSSSLSSTVSSLSSKVASMSSTLSSVQSSVSSLNSKVASLQSSVSSLSSLPSTVSSIKSSSSTASTNASRAEYFAIGALIVAIIVLIIVAYMAFAKS